MGGHGRPAIQGAPAREILGVRALGLDPGLVETGYAILEAARQGVTVVETGVLRARADAPLEVRLEQLYTEVGGLLDRLHPELVVIEEIYAESKFPRTAILMGHARGVICLAARQRNMTILPLTPAEVKRATTANGRASKGQVQRATQALLGLQKLPRPSHVADALGLALTGLSRAGVAFR